MTRMECRRYAAHSVDIGEKSYEVRTWGVGHRHGRFGRFGPRHHGAGTHRCGQAALDEILAFAGSARGISVGAHDAGREAHAGLRSVRDRLSAETISRTDRG